VTNRSIFGMISLRTQLVLTFAGCIAATAAVLGTLTYQRTQAILEAQARLAVSSAARNRADVVSNLVASQQQHAAGFLVTLASLCGETMTSGRMTFEVECAQRALNELRLNERALAAVLTDRSRRIVSSGRIAQPLLPIPGPLARLVSEPSGLQYAIQADAGRTAVRLQFPITSLYGLFGEAQALGTGGEMFIRTAAGTFLTPARYAAAGDVTGADMEAPAACGSGPSQRLDVDYRGVQTVHGTHPIAGFSDGLCVEAHLSEDEVLAPARTLLADLIAQGGLLTLFGVALAIVSSWFIASPVRRLALWARAVEGGDFDRPMRIAGPSDVRRLARSFAAMALAVRELITREQRARRDAESASRAKDEFLAVLSHELRTPLTATLGWIRLLRAGTLTSAATDKALVAIERSSRTQAQLIEDLLDVSRIVAGRLELRLSDVSFADAVRAAVDGARPAADAKRMAIDCELGPAAVVRGDPLRLQQVIANLIANAVKFTPAGGRVNVRVREMAGSVELTVSDNGVGIAPEFLPHLFEAFRQADAGATRAHGGLGLGLSIVRHLVKLHGGTVQAASEGAGRGATFTVSVPKTVGLTGGSGLGSAATAAAPIGEASPGQRLTAMRVLLVEDDDDTRQLVASLLEQAGAQVDAAASADEARRYLAIRDYKAIVSDLVMPNENGFAFIRGIRSAHNHVPAIALTALGRREDATEAYASGFQMFLRKPVNGDQLVSALVNLAHS
jgi:signal transduction histidine kinase/CheY-like chemotaxis protein